MIVLCANCHRLKGTGPRSLDRKALRQLKANLGRINQRYNDTERRVLEYFAENGPESTVTLPGSEVLFSYLVKDGIIDRAPESLGSVTIYTDDDSPPFFVTAGYNLTETGRELIANYAENEPIP